MTETVRAGATPLEVDALAELDTRIKRLQGPILVLGGSGFIGANLVRRLASVRADVVGTATRLPAWRLAGLATDQVRVVDLLVESNVTALLAEVKPRTVLDCVAYGAYSFETNGSLIYRTNFHRVCRLVELLAERRVACYVHSGSSSEYGANAAGPLEMSHTAPNSEYSVSKVAAANLLYYWGKHKRFPCCNLRLYSIYGPLEDSSRLIPNVVRRGVEGGYPEFVDPSISRDFVYVEDAVHAYVLAALNLAEADYGESFNIASGTKTTIADIAAVAKEEFGIAQAATFKMASRRWDITDWYGNADKVRARLGWSAATPFRQGLARTVEWYRGIEDKAAYERTSKRFGLDTKHSVSAIIACYRDAQAIPIMHKRLKECFAKLDIDHEIVFVNDCSPDDSEEVIRSISQNDRRVIGISHSRNFGSQAAFMSGMRICTKNSCVLLDGDLQDPPELIEQFVARWKEGYDVVYGRRVKREATLFMQLAYKAFYRVFDYFSYVRVPRDAGDFSLLDRRVIDALVRFPERDLFLRGVRAFAGFRQTGVDYVRPERMFGRSTNSLLKNLGWAKKGILSFSNVPLNMLSAAGFLLLILTGIALLVQVVLKLLWPQLAAEGVISILVLVGFFGSVNLFALGLIGEYIAKIFEEVKRRPLFIRRSVISDGEVRPAGDESSDGS